MNRKISMAVAAVFVMALAVGVAFAITDTDDHLFSGRNIFQSTWNNITGQWQIDGTEVTSTAAELNLLDGTATDSGTAVGLTTAAEYVVGEQHKTVLTFASVKLPLADGGFQVSSNIYTFPAGVILIEGATLNATATMGADGFTNSTADLYNFAVGTTVANDGDGAMSGTEVDVIPSTSVDTINGTNLVSQVHAYGPVPARHDGTATAISLYASMGIPAANDSGANTNTITGTLTFFWKNLGDY